MKLPRLFLKRLGLYISVLGFDIIIASTPAASAVRKTAPIFPGFSGDSNTTINVDLKPKKFQDLTLLSGNIKKTFNNSKIILAYSDDLSL